jgi:3-methylcrotonyl-CoA carboxylase alpha subunit
MQHSTRFRWRDTEILARVVVRAVGAFEVEVDDTVHNISRDGDHWIVDGARMRARIATDNAAITVFMGDAFTFERIGALERAVAAGARADLVPAPMPGLVKDVFVSVGQPVAPGDRLAVLEAMKMEHVLTASHDGVVAEVMCSPGTQVEAGAALIRFEAE